MYKLAFSICAKFSGEHPELSEYWPCETTLSDVLSAWPGDPEDPSAPYDTDFQYLAREGSIPREILDVLDGSETETRFRICRKLKGRFGSEAFWACLSDVQLDGIFDRKTLFKFLSDIRAAFEDVETMGTLGGPLGWLVPDFSFNVESQALIASIRITPCLCRVMDDGRLDPVRPPSEWQWGCIREILKETDCWELSR